MTTPLPDWATPHVASIRLLLGSGGMGSTYSDPIEIPCFAEEEIKLVRNAMGAEVVSSAQIHMNFDPPVPPGSLAMTWGTEREVIAVGRHEAPGWPAYQTLSLA